MVSKTNKKKTKSVKVNGRSIKYTNEKDLVKKIMTSMKINKKDSKNFVNKLLKNRTKTFVIGTKSEEYGDEIINVDQIEEIDFRKNFKDILKQKYDLKRISVKRIITENIVNKEAGIKTKRNLGNSDQISTLSVIIGVTWRSIGIDAMTAKISQVYGNEKSLAFINIYNDLHYKLSNSSKIKHVDNRINAREAIYREYFNKVKNLGISDINFGDMGVEKRTIYMQISPDERETIGNDEIKLYNFVKNNIIERLAGASKDNFGFGDDATVLFFYFNTLTYVRTYNRKGHGLTKKQYKRFKKEAKNANIIKEYGYYVGEKEYTLEEWTKIEYLGSRKKNKDSCAVKFIEKRYSELYNEIKKYETKKGISLEDFSNFCNNNNIYYIFNDICGNIIGSNENKFSEITYELDKSALRAIIYENHVYPYSGSKLNRKKISTKETHNTNNIEKKMFKILETGKIPARIQAYSAPDEKGNKILSIKSFVSSNIKYISNPQYNRCVKILNKLGYTQNIQTDINLFSLIKFIAKEDKCEKDKLSFFPEKNYYKSNAILYQKRGIDKMITDKKLDKNTISGIDKNKCYPYALCELPYLISHDWRKHNVKYLLGKKNIDIIDYHLYLVEPKYFSVMLPYKQIYPGYHIKKAKKIGIDFNIIEEYETETTYNYFRDIVKRLYTVLTNDEFKNTMVILIGKFERNISKEIDYTYNGIYNERDSKHFGGTYKKIGEMYLHFKENIQYKYVRDNLPYNIQIKSKTYELLSDKIIELKIKAEDIIQINTDSIYFRDHSGKYNKNNFTENEISEMKSDFNGWKILTEFKSMPSSEIIVNKTFVETLKLKNKNSNSKRILHMKYAGNGKTHYIVNELVPKLKLENKSYIILTPTHSTLEDYKIISEQLVEKEKFYISNNLPYEKHKVGKLNCGIIQEYSFNFSVPDVDYVIVDEIGFCGADIHDFLYKLNYLSKSYECFGDFNQLPAVGENDKYNQKHYLKYMFDEIRTEFYNFRNDFTKEFYDSIINSKLDPLEVVLKYSTPIKKIDFTDPLQVCICYHTEIRDYVNKMILEKLKLDVKSIGVRVLCTDNTLGKIGIWNNTQYIITKKNEECITLTNLNGKTFNVSQKNFECHFRPAYCINVHAAQGKSLKAYNWITLDNSVLDKKIPNRENLARENIAYTIVSRLIHKKTEISTTLLRANQRIEEIHNTANNINWNNIFNK